MDIKVSRFDKKMNNKVRDLSGQYPFEKTIEELIPNEEPLI
jgi:hypothetical protein